MTTHNRIRFFFTLFKFQSQKGRNLIIRLRNINNGREVERTKMCDKFQLISRSMFPYGNSIFSNFLYFLNWMFLSQNIQILIIFFFSFWDTNILALERTFYDNPFLRHRAYLYLDRHKKMISKQDRHKIKKIKIENR